eukprot:Nitzschia sp. Nitz4//scaffold14_size191712//109472//110839//NITZ4_001730-RA/size191712-processed-gene-0.276-mRNA-1//1//CDS//3329536948//3391//frame0
MFDHLVPEFDSSKRHSSLVVAIFNLSATIVGGGVLSLPLAFSKCGLVLGSLLMVFGAIVTERSLYLLCLCARRTGASTYGEVGRAAFGTSMEYFISLLLFVFLLFVILGYMVLAQDIWSSLLSIVVSQSMQEEIFSHPHWVLILLVLGISPFAIQRDLYSLRYNCYIGFASVSTLCVALCHHVWVTPLPTNPPGLLMWSHSWNDTLFAFPIIVLSFMSIFNVLPIQGGLICPTRPRLLWVIQFAVGSCFVLMLLFGLTGYIYVGMTTEGNILDNLRKEHSLWFIIGRFGCGVTILLAMPMMLLPCRASLLEVLEVLVQGGHKVEDEVSIPTSSTEVVWTSEETPLILDNVASSQRDVRPLSERAMFHYGSTFGILLLCYIAAVKVPGIAFVWSLCGSSMAYMIAFTLPAACYLQLQRQPGWEEPSRIWVVFAWFLVVASILASIACTWQTFGEYA